MKTAEALKVLERLIENHPDGDLAVFTPIRTDIDRLSKAVCFDGIVPCEKYPEGVCISKITSKNGKSCDMWMVVEPADHQRVLGQNDEWLDGDSSDGVSAEFTLDEAFAAIEKLKSRIGVYP